MTTTLRRVRRAAVRSAVVLAAFAPPPLSLRAQAAPLPGVINLGTVLDIVRTRAPLTDAARARARVARGERATAGNIGNPWLAYQAENLAFPGSSKAAEHAGQPAEHSVMSVERMATATLPLAPIYQRGPRVQQANANVRAADAEIRIAQQAITLDAARAYYRAALAQVTVDATENVSAWLDSLVAYNRSRVQQGIAAEADLIRTELERDNARADAARHSAELARARATLAAFIGDPTRRAFAVRLAVDDMPLRMPAAADTDDVTLGSDTIDVERRPDMIAIRERLSAAEAGAALEQRMIVRDFGAMAGVKSMAGTTSMVVGVSMPLPLFDWNRGERTRARAERDAVAFDVSARQRGARAELLGAEEAARLLTTRVGELAARDSAGTDVAYLRRANDARTIALGAFREGAVSLLQVLDAARAWSDARITFYRTLFAQHEAVLELVSARGDDLLAALPVLMPASSRPSPAR